jgi:rhomboid family GlyGly-CTERM serine protease
VLQFLPADWQRALWYDRGAVATGEWWRLLSGNLVHLGWRHLFLNVTALVIGIGLFHAARTPIGWLAAQVTCSLTTNVGLYLLNPEISWCIGMSGALHGLLIIGSVDMMRDGDRLGAALLIIWIGKLAWEQWSGAMPLSLETVGAPVITDAHLYGAAGGFLFVAAESLRRYYARRV